MSKKNDPNKFKFPTNIRSDSFTDFLNASLETERLLPIETTQILNELSPSPTIDPTIDNSPSVISNNEKVDTIEAKLPARVESLSDDTIVPVNGIVSPFTNLSQYVNSIVNDPSVLSGKSIRFRMANESHKTIKIIHQTLVQHGIYITMPRLLDFIIQGHADTITHLIKSLKKRSLKSKR